MWNNPSRILFSLTIICLFLHLSASKSEPQKFKILCLLSHPGKSHFAVFRPILEELALRGHELTVFSYFPRDNKSSILPNYKDIDLRQRTGVYEDVVDMKEIKHSLLTPFKEFMWIHYWAMDHCQEALENDGVKKLIESKEKYDLIITEVFNSDCFLGFAHKFNVPVVAVSSHVLMPWANARISNGHHSSYVPTIFVGYEPNMNFLQRFVNTFFAEIFATGYEIVYNWPMQKLVDKAFGYELPSLNDLAKNTTAILVNSHWSLQGSRHLLHNIIEVGGIHLARKEKKPLPEDIKRFLDEGREGVLIFSFGSMIKASSMRQETLDILLSVLGSIPRRVIWKWEDENLPGKPKNMMIKKWLPQVDILAHPNVKCYLAHGGMLGLSEGVQNGVPLVIVPMYGDQFNNAAAAKSRGVAEVLEWNDFDAKMLRNALDRVFNDSTYQKNAKILQKAWNDRPEPPLETAVWWVEYIARGNGNHLLKTAASNLSWYQQNLLDVYAMFLVIILTITAALYKLVSLLMKKFIRTTSTKHVNGVKKRN